MSTRYFSTALGVASVSWNDHGLTRFHLPEENAKLPGGAFVHAPPEIEHLIAQAQEHFAGKPHDYVEIQLDWTQVTPFQRKVYHEAQTIKAGHTTTYGAIAERLGLGREGARSVGVALGANPWPLIVPCHRVIASDGKMTGFFRAGRDSDQDALAGAGAGRTPLRMKPRFLYVPDEAVAHLRAEDELLARAMDAVGPFTLKPRPVKSIFEALLRSIVYQQLHGSAAAAIHARVIAQLKAHGGTTPEALAKAPDAGLRGAGLSANKLLAARDLARKCLEGKVPTLREAHRLDDAELVARLTEVRGIGPWTVHMLLIFYLGRPDVLPTGDFAIRAAFRRLYKKRRDPTPETMIRHARRWQPYRSVASWYLWRSLDTKL